MFLSIKTKISLLIVAIIAFSLGLCNLLNFLNYEKTYGELRRSRFLVVARETRSTLESCLNLGLSLAEMRNTDEVIRGIVGASEDVASIHVLDEAGRIVNRAGGDVGDGEAGAVGAAGVAPSDGAAAAGGRGEVPGPVREAADRIANGGDEAAGDLTVVAGDGTWILLLPLRNAFEARCGTLALEYTREGADNPVGAMRAYLVRGYLIVLVVVSILVCVGVRLSTRGLIAGLREIEQEICRVGCEPAAPEGAAARDREGRPATVSDERVVEFARASREALTALEDARKGGRR